jgi:hypothetical protein
MRFFLAGAAVGGLLLTGCSQKPPALPADPVDKAATCGAIRAASEQQAVGAGHLSAEAQERVLHYALLAGATDDGGFDRAHANMVINRTTTIFDQATKGKWQTLQPACAAAYPAIANRTPKLPDQPFDRDLQCYVLIDFMHRALGQIGGRYAEAATGLGVMADKFDTRVGPAVKKQGLDGDRLQARKGRALVEAARLGTPPEVIKACEAVQPAR